MAYGSHQTHHWIIWLKKWAVSLNSPDLWCFIKTLMCKNVFKCRYCSFSCRYFTVHLLNFFWWGVHAKGSDILTKCCILARFQHFFFCFFRERVFVCCCCYLRDRTSVLFLLCMPDSCEIRMQKCFQWLITHDVATFCLTRWYTGDIKFTAWQLIWEKFRRIENVEFSCGTKGLVARQQVTG